ncbi:MAG: hypothetical protein MJ025_04660, partial [Victivallaceae bacterium]|nr:hypothetical protein [Victivallaceae bacterium]
SRCGQSWRLAGTIVLDEVLSPKTIFTFVRRDYEMTVLLSRRDGNVTDFFYKIEKCQVTN